MEIDQGCGDDGGLGKPDSGYNNHLKKCVSLAESASGAALVEIIKQALESPSIYVFGELLDVANVRALNESAEYAPYLNLLNIFAYGTYKKYQKQKAEMPASLPELNELMLTKLRHLSILSLARCRRHIPYQILLQELELTNIRQLEDLIIEAIYANIIKGTMDQRNNRLEIDQTIARDVRPEDFTTITNVLTEWCRSCEKMLSTIEHQIQMANNHKDESMRNKHSLEAKIMLVRKNLKTAENDDLMMTDLGEKTTTKRISQRPIKSSFKNANLKSWKREN